MKRINRIFLLLILIGVLAGMFTNSSGQSSPVIYLPQIVRSSLVAPDDEAATRLSVPPGFSIRIYAQGLTQPRLMELGPDGWVYAAEMGRGRIVRLPDRDGNFIADGIEVVAINLNSPHNLEWRGSQLYVAETGRVSRLLDQNSDGTYETRQTITENIPGSGGHGTRTLHFGPDGMLYVSAGSSCNVCEETDPRRAAILRFTPEGGIPADNPFASDPDTRKRAVWAWGLRNSVDFLWTAGGSLWANHMGSDQLGDAVPPEEIVIPVQGNRSHGWPYCYTGVLGPNPTLQSEVRDTRLALPSGFTCAQAVPALFTSPAHSAPLGMVTGAGSSFPTAYQDDLFVAYHGSWNTTSANYRDCKVERIIVEDGVVTGSQTFVTGWRAAGSNCGATATWGRPAGVVIGADGSLYISDDKNGRIFRVTYIGG